MRNYDGPAGRRGGQGSVGGGRRILSIDEIWSDRQRELFRKINEKREQLDTWEKVKQLRTDELSILIADLAETGMTKSRIAKMFRITPSGVSDLLVRAETARAILDAAKNYAAQEENYEQCGCLKNEGGAHRVGCPDHPEGVKAW